jgi:Protein of unknown function (DUF3592)
MRLKYIALIALIGGPIIAFSGYSEKKDHEKIVAEGVKVEGVITGGESSKRRRRGTTYTFDIEFKTKDGKAVKKNLSVPKSFVDAHVQGDTITNDKVEVLYLPSDPNKCEVVGVKSEHEAMLYGGSVAGAAGLLGTVLIFRKKR